jgi:surface antigen
MNKKIASILLVTLSLSACAQDGSSNLVNNQTIGSVIGGLGGAAVGSQFGEGRGRTLAIIAGGLAGTIIGGTLGSNLDANDARMSQNTAQQALSNNSVGQTSSWNNPSSGNSGTITPQGSYQTASGNCRQFEQTVTTADGQLRTGYGTACQQADGSWRITQNAS